MRKAISGYPVSPYQMDKNQLFEYLSGERLVCLLCGWSFKMLGGNHIKSHGIAVDDYKEMYGIPYTASLNCSGLRQKKSNIAKDGCYVLNLEKNKPKNENKSNRRKSAASTAARKENMLVALKKQNEKFGHISFTKRSLTVDQVLYIKSSEKRNRDLALELGVSRHKISAIRNGHLYRSVTNGN